MGITEERLEGDKWICVEPPSNGQLKQVSVNTIGVWAIDNQGRIHVRKEITTTFPEGTHWQTIYADPPVLSKFRKFIKHIYYTTSLFKLKYSEIPITTE